jgi:hypothetical protein
MMSCKVVGDNFSKYTVMYNMMPKMQKITIETLESKIHDEITFAATQYSFKLSLGNMNY